jgi:hypothetical protein
LKFVIEGNANVLMAAALGLRPRYVGVPKQLARFIRSSAASPPPPSYLVNRELRIADDGSEFIRIFLVPF